jgi:hypothetical protein
MVVQVLGPLLLRNLVEMPKEMCGWKVRKVKDALSNLFIRSKNQTKNRHKMSALSK